MLVKRRARAPPLRAIYRSGTVRHALMADDATGALAHEQSVETGAHTAVAPALAAFSFAHVVLSLAAARQKLSVWDPEIWVYGDSDHYLSIAERGYEFFSCARVPGYDPKLWCGNTGWFPLYPLTVSPLLHLGVRPAIAGFLTSAVFVVAALMLLWNVFLAECAPPKRWLVLLIAAFFPGQVYLHAVFPMGLFALLVLLSVHWLTRERWQLAGLGFALAAATYPAGILAAAAGALWVFADRQRGWPERFARATWYAGAGLAGFAIVCLALQLMTGHWDAFFRVHDKYSHDLRNPIEALQPVIEGAWSYIREPHLPLVPPVQTVVLTVLLLSAGLAPLLQRKRLQAAERFLLLFAAVYWAFPLIAGDMTSVRAEATLLPAVVLGRNLPLPGLLALLLILMPVAYLVGQLFFAGLLS